MNRLSKALFFILSLPFILYSQYQNVQFEQISIEQGLLGNFVHCILKDHKGYMWFGTNRGLIKYDGYKFNYYHGKNNPLGQDIFTVTSICETHYNDKNEIWGGTIGKGIFKLDLETEQVTSYLHDPNNPKSLSHNFVTAIYRDKTGILWFGTYNGLNRFDRKSEQFKHYMYNPDDSFGANYNNVNTIYEDQLGTLWIGTSGGLSKFDRETEQFTRFIYNPADSSGINKNQIRSICEDQSGNLYIGTSRQGLYILDRETNRVYHYLQDTYSQNRLSDNFIWSICRTYHGDKNEIWIGTSRGFIDKFDPETKRILHYSPDSTGSSISSIYEDPAGILWVGRFGKGLNKLDVEKINFTQYNHDQSNPTILHGKSITQIYEDNSGTIWVGTHEGLNKFDIEKGEHSHFRHNPDNLLSLSNNYIQSIYEDQRGILWIGTYDGLNTFNRETEHFEQFKHDSNDPFSLSQNNIRSIYEDRSGEVWIGTFGGGLNRFDPKTKQFTHYKHNPDNTNSLSNNYVLSISETYREGRNVLWIGTRSGLNRLDIGTGTFTRYLHDSKNPNSINNNVVWAIAASQRGKEEVLWLGTNRGLNKFELTSEKFTHFRDENELYDEPILGIVVDEYKYLWINTRTGLSKFDPESSEFQNYDEKVNLMSKGFPKKMYTKTASIREEAKDVNKDVEVGPDGTIFLAGLEDGLFSYHYDGTSFTQIAHIPSMGELYDIALGSDNYIYMADGEGGLRVVHYDGFSFSDIAHIYTGDQANYVALDSNGTIFLANKGDGIRAYDFDGSSLTNTAHYYTGGISNGVAVGRDGIIFVADAATGLRAFRYDGSSFTNIANISHGLNQCDVAVGRDGTIFLANYSDGLRAYEFDGSSFHNTAHIYNGGKNAGRAFKVKQGPDGTVFICNAEDGVRGYSYSGSSFSNIAHMSTKGEAWGIGVGHDDGTVFVASDNLMAYNYTGTSFLKSRQGKMFFGGPNGLITFYPNSLDNNFPIPPIVITDFKLYNEPVSIMKNDVEGRDSEYYLPKHISYLQDIELSHKENFLSFEYSTLDYRNPQDNQYAHKMEGVNPDWVYTDASHRSATYTNLDPGNYTFRVKGSNSVGLWNEEGTYINITITPPWWRTNLAYTLYFFLFVSIIYFTWRVQLRRIRLKQQLKMEHFEAEKLREVDQLKSRFFANISHEFRTPLTLIKGPVKQIMDGEFAGNLKEQCKMILRNSDRLLGLINQILDLSKLESGEMKLQVSKTDIGSYLKGLILSFSPLADRKKITLKFRSDDEFITGFIDRDKTEKIITNLLSNAFKFTPENGVINVECGMRNADFDEMKNIKFRIPNSEFRIFISNTGPGIPPDQMDKIFDRFYQADSTYKKDGEGSGIGLALTKELVEACHGEITVSSTANEITTFTVTLPISKERFKEDEIIEKKEIADLSDGRVPSIEDSRLKRFPLEITSGSNHPGFDQHPASRILIVEDNPDVTSYICSFLDQQYRIMSAENGKEGLKKVLDKYPDLIISDVMMPEMDGFEFCQRIKSDERISHIPVILLTAKADLDSKIEGLEFGADDYVTKPFEARELQIRVKNLIEQRRKLREKFTALVDLNPADIAASSMDEQLLKRLLTVFEDHMEEAEFSIEQLAREIGMSRSHLNRKIQALANVSTSEFIRTLRLQRAARLLSNASGSVSEIAYKVGFNNLSYFSKAFRRHFGKLPSELNKNE